MSATADLRMLWLGHLEHCQQCQRFEGSDKPATLVHLCIEGAQKFKRLKEAENSEYQAVRGNR